MNQNDKSDAQDGVTDSEARSQLSQALKDLARGEQTANALENNLSKLESKLDELLASFEDSVEEITTEKDAGGPTKSAGEGHDGNAKDLEEKRD
ncbi:hypothetical protein CONLIGDRAFT_676199 [Coniochaeta ligniaria NRRL 30616]|uniref:Uncharacterized protein n=1 Tax=Coniochaeta ligniaria NRRL 30616 TaxID=1408157 RepID=A0A1J7J7D6_9PEZI|nr:hypothetical protein CONLIGDRAFT_676199 [Coniochaeta ligniaria NRRL 30616]